MQKNLPKVQRQTTVAQIEESIFGDTFHERAEEYEDLLLQLVVCLPIFQVQEFDSKAVYDNT